MRFEREFFLGGGWGAGGGGIIKKIVFASLISLSIFFLNFMNIFFKIFNNIN